jgi:hypothetical protein
VPSEAPGTVLEWNNGSGETPYNLLKQHGYDPNLFVNDDGIIISRGAMVAAERYFAYHRWGYPFGPNPQYLGYRDFHFASGLAELYRTGEGKASESYQVYWEEARHPYFEFGSPTDPSGYFRTTTPSAKGRNFYEHATMSLRRQDPDTMTWLGWEMPVLGQENRMRKFATAFRALPVVTPTTFGGTVTPTQAEVVARWYDDRLAVINDTNSAKTITLDFSGDPLPSGKQLVNVVTGAILMVSGQEGNGPASVDAEAFSLNTYKLQDAPTVYAADFDGDQDVDVSDFSKFTLCFNGANQPPAQPNCDATDLDGDNDVDVVGAGDRSARRP